MGLTDSKKLFFQIRKKCRILVKNHAFRDYPERCFSKIEIIHLIREGEGEFKNNDLSDMAIPGSFLFFPKDDEKRKCKLVILIEESTIDGEESGPYKEIIIVCSAYREI